MKSLPLGVIAVFSLWQLAVAEEHDDGFQSISELRKANPRRWFRESNIDEIFDTRGVAAHFAAVKRVRLFRRLPGSVSDPDIYQYLEGNGPVKTLFSVKSETKELSKSQFRPVLEIAADFEQYGDMTECAFKPGVAVLIGEDEPEIILVCCFSCHEIRVIRRPTSKHPKLQMAVATMSPKLDKAMFDLTLASYPEDTELLSFKQDKAKRSETQQPSIIPTPGPASEKQNRTDSKK